MNCLRLIVLSSMILSASSMFAQPEVYPWGNISGIRLDGEIMELNSSLDLVGTGWEDAWFESDKEKGRYSYRRRDNTQFTSVSIEDFMFNQSVEALGAGRASVRINFSSESDTSVIGSFFKLELPASKYSSTSLKLKDEVQYLSSGVIPVGPNEILRGTAKGLKISGESRDLFIAINEKTHIVARKDTSDDNSPVELYFALMTGQMDSGTSVFRTFDIRATGAADFSPVVLTLDTSVLGRSFTGFGGNFRLQNADSDPAVIDYCLENMDVRWGRVEMPWRFWHPEEGEDPVEKAKSEGLHPRVEAAMEMAQRLHKLGMPVILSDWSAPGWAITGPTGWGPRPGGLRGNPLDQDKTEEIYKSIADYIQYVKDHYGFEFAMFSFNESDLGIYVRQTPEEHAKLIRELGAYLVSRGINTKLLLGDTADANGWPFVEAAMDDSSAHPFIGAVSFHSWRGYSDKNLEQWYQIAERMKLPLIVGEGSMDAGAHRYPHIFSEPMYAMEEMNLYVRIMKICQPESILQWQLTSDYSPMVGGSVFGEVNAPLAPTQRFWNFKQLADMPAGLFSMPVDSDRDNIICAGLGDNDKGLYTIHVVNNGATRMVTLKGLPSDVRFMKVFITNEKSSMSQPRMVWVRNGEAIFFAESNSFITLLVDGESPF